MNLKTAVKIGKDCGLKNITECILNIEMHSMNFFAYSNVDKELTKLNLEIEKIAEDYGVSIEEVLSWTISEYYLYV